MAKTQRSSAVMHLFLASGHTFTFRDVVITFDNETTITFVYQAMSDGRSKVATFSKAHVAGVSLLNE